MEALADYGSSSDDECSSRASGTQVQKISEKEDRSATCKLAPKQEKGHETRGYVSKRKLRGMCEDLTGPDTRAQSSAFHLSHYLLREDNDSVTKRKRFSSTIPKVCEALSSEHSKPVVSLSWHNSNETVLLSCSLDGTSKLWDTARKKCIASFSPHSEAGISCGEWVSHNTVVTSGFNSFAVLSDVEKGLMVTSFRHKDFVSVVRVHPHDKNLVFSGDFGANIYSWDLRTGKTVKQYKGAGGRILDMNFLQSGQELIASSDIVRKNASCHALKIWEIDSAVAVSNQVYSEPYTCPCLKTHPYRNEFYAQSNANYIVVFSSRKPYKCNKRKRYETHRVDGNKVQFDVSPDGTLLCSGSADGRIVIYDCETSAVVKTLSTSNTACTAVAWNRHTPSTIAVSDWKFNISLLK